MESTRRASNTAPMPQPAPTSQGSETQAEAEPQPSLARPPACPVGPSPTMPLSGSSGAVPAALTPQQQELLERMRPLRSNALGYILTVPNAQCPMISQFITHRILQALRGVSRGFDTAVLGLPGFEPRPENYLPFRDRLQRICKLNTTFSERSAGQELPPDVLERVLRFVTPETSPEAHAGLAALRQLVNSIQTQGVQADSAEQWMMLAKGEASGQMAMVIEEAMAGNMEPMLAAARRIEGRTGTGVVHWLAREEASAPKESIFKRLRSFASPKSPRASELQELSKLLKTTYDFGTLDARLIVISRYAETERMHLASIKDVEGMLERGFGDLQFLAPLRRCKEWVQAGAQGRWSDIDVQEFGETQLRLGLPESLVKRFNSACAEAAKGDNNLLNAVIRDFYAQTRALALRSFIVDFTRDANRGPRSGALWIRR